MSPRITWPDLGVIVVVLAFVVFETICLKLPITEAAINAVAIVGAVVMFLFAPKTFTQLLRWLQEVHTMLGAVISALPVISTVVVPPGAAADNGALPISAGQQT